MKRFDCIHAVVLTFMLVPCTILGQSKTNECSRLAVHAGIGSLFAGSGILLEVQIPIVKNIKLDPFIALGSQAIHTPLPGTWLGYTGGLTIEFGKIDFGREKQLNWLFGINYGSQGVGSDKVIKDGVDSSDTEWLHKHLLTGFACITGYRFYRKRFIWQINMGLCYIHNPISSNTNYFYKPTGGFGVGYRF